MLKPTKIPLNGRKAIALKGSAPKAWHPFLNQQGVEWTPRLLCFLYPMQPLPEPVQALLAAQKSLDANEIARVLNGEVAHPGQLNPTWLPDGQPAKAKPVPRAKPKPDQLPEHLTITNALESAITRTREDIAKYRAPRKTNTHKQREHARAALKKVLHAERLLYALTLMADLWRKDEVPDNLRPITTRRMVETLLTHTVLPQKAHHLAERGIKTDAQYVALREALLARIPSKVGQSNRQDKIYLQELAVLDKEIRGYFPTPITTVKHLIARADIRAYLPIHDEPPLRILEPSAGSGNIADTLRETFGNAIRITAIEVNHDLAELLKMKGHHVKHTDFMTWETAERFHRILMNPPFAKWAGEGWQDIAHVRKAYGLLADGGVLVAIVARRSVTRNDDRQTIAFKQWIDDLDGYHEPLPEDTFRESGTLVSTSVVVLRKPSTEPAPFTPPENGPEIF